MGLNIYGERLLLEIEHYSLVVMPQRPCLLALLTYSLLAALKSRACHSASKGTLWDRTDAGRASCRLARLFSLDPTIAVQSRQTMHGAGRGLARD